MFGSGSAGIGIVNLLITAMKEEGLTEEQARKRIYAFNRYGLLVEGCQGIRPGQEPLAAQARGRGGWKLSGAAAPSRCSTWCAMPRSRCWSASPHRRAHSLKEIVREMARHIDAAGDLSALEPNFEVRSRARRPAALDRRPRPGRNRQSVCPRSRSTANMVRISQINNSYHLSRPGSRHSGFQSPARYRRHDHGRGQSARLAVACARG